MLLKVIFLAVVKTLWPVTSLKHVPSVRRCVELLRPNVKRQQPGDKSNKKVTPLRINQMCHI